VGQRINTTAVKRYKEPPLRFTDRRFSPLHRSRLAKGIPATGPVPEIARMQCGGRRCYPVGLVPRKGFFRWITLRSSTLQ
jgi:hypothetical protein